MWFSTLTNQTIKKIPHFTVKKRNNSLSQLKKERKTLEFSQ